MSLSKLRGPPLTSKMVSKHVASQDAGSLCMRVSLLLEEAESADGTDVRRAHAAAAGAAQAAAKLLKIATSCGNQRLMFRAFMSLGNARVALQQHAAALDAFAAARRASVDSSSEEAEAARGLARAHRGLGCMRQAIICTDRAYAVEFKLELERKRSARAAGAIGAAANDSTGRGRGRSGSGSGSRTGSSAGDDSTGMNGQADASDSAADGARHLALVLRRSAAPAKRVSRPSATPVAASAGACKATAPLLLPQASMRRGSFDPDLITALAAGGVLAAAPAALTPPCEAATKARRGHRRVGSGA